MSILSSDSSSGSGAVADASVAGASATFGTMSPIAIVGVGLRFPGGVRTLADYGRFLTAGEPAIGPVPEDRWDGARRGNTP